MLVLHQANPQSKDQILSAGLKRTSRGDKGDDKLIAKTDSYLDKIMPEVCRKKGLSRTNSVYAYICLGGTVIDIQDGNHWQRSQFIDAKRPALLGLAVEARRVYVSDLDKYDAVKSAIGQRMSGDTLKSLGDDYWNSVMSLADFTGEEINRPEAIIPYDIPPSRITLLK